MYKRMSDCRGCVLDAAVVAVALAQQPVVPGSADAGLTSREFELFRVGREDFMEVETAEDGLGPMFNGTSCAQCHNIPAVGGTGTMVETRAGYRDEERPLSRTSRRHA